MDIFLFCVSVSYHEPNNESAKSVSCAGRKFLYEQYSTNAPSLSIKLIFVMDHNKKLEEREIIGALFDTGFSRQSFMLVLYQILGRMMIIAHK